MTPTKPHLGQRLITPELRERLAWILGSEAVPGADALWWAMTEHRHASNMQANAGRHLAQPNPDRAELLARLRRGAFVSVAQHRPVIYSVAEDVDQSRPQLVVVLRVAVHRGMFMEHSGAAVPFRYEVLVHAWDAATYQKIEKVATAAKRRTLTKDWRPKPKKTTAPGRTRSGAAFHYLAVGGRLPIIEIYQKNT